MTDIQIDAPDNGDTLDTLLQELDEEDKALELEHEADERNRRSEERQRQADEHGLEPDEVDPRTVQLGLAAMTVPLANAVCQRYDVSSLESGEEEALTQAVAGYLPFIVPRSLTPKQSALAGLAMVCLAIAAPRIQEAKAKAEATTEATT